MRMTSSRTYTRSTPVPKMPPGLVQLMEGLTKDVLKHNPTNVFGFCANHMEKLLEIRDGPSSKKPLTLEQKIAKAQEKVRQRAKERQQHFDKGFQGDMKIEPKKQDSEEGDRNPHNKELMSNLRAPVHTDKDLSLASEVEISHEAFTDNSLTPRDSNIDETDDIGVSKSSTYSSDSKTTVVDVGNDTEKEVVEGTEAPKDDKNEETIKETEIDDPLDHKTTEKETIELSTEDVTNEQENIDSSMPDNNDFQQEAKKDSEYNVIDEVDNTAVKEFDKKITIKENEFFDDTNIILKNEDEFTLQLRSLNEINAIIEERDRDMVDVGINLGRNDSNNYEAVFNDESVGMNIKNDTSNITEIVSPNLDDAKSENILETDIPLVVTITENVTKSIENTVQKKPVIEDNSDNTLAVDNHTKNSNSNEASALQLINVENQTEINEQQSCATVKVIEEVTNPTLEKKEKDYPEKNVKIENEIISTAQKEDDINTAPQDAFTRKHDLGNNEDDEPTPDVTSISKKHEELNKDDPENTRSSSLTRLDSTDNNDDSSVIGSDLSKVDDDLSQNESQNGHNNMDLETAAVTIQKVFRSFLFKSRNSTFEDITNDDTTSLEEDSDRKEEYFVVANLNKDRRPLGITRMDTVLQTVNEEKSLSLSTDDSSTLSSAATTIQAHVRGFLVRNKLNSYKTVSTNSLVNSNEMLDTDTELQKNKTVLNIHIVPEQGNYLSRDESLITSMDLSLDGSPPSSVNLHPLSYDISERRKLLKREDAIQSVSPPSNNSGKLSEDSVKEVLLNENDAEKTEHVKEDHHNPDNVLETPVSPVTAVTIRDSPSEQEAIEIATENRMVRTSTDESDVITPFDASPRSLVGDFENSSKLVHSGEFHDIVLPTKVSRSDTTVVREFKNVLVYILLWNN